MNEIKMFFIGFSAGVLLVIILLSVNVQKGNIKSPDVSLAPVPQELPKDIEYDEIKIQFKLKEVIL